MRRSALGSIRWLVVLIVLVLGATFLPLVWRSPAARRMQAAVTGRSSRATVEERVAWHGPGARQRLAPYFRAAGVPYPPRAITLAVFKHEEEVQLYAHDDERIVFVRSYAITAASGTLGPKLREGDRQVPEGLYRVTYLNPNSRHHLSLRVGYPSEQDQERARQEGRVQLGGDIMIHGGASSIGCVAVGDEPAEDLFILAAETGMRNVRILITPVDFRRRELPSGYPPVRPWVPELYRELRAELAKLPAPRSES